MALKVVAIAFVLYVVKNYSAEAGGFTTYPCTLGDHAYCKTTVPEGDPSCINNMDGNAFCRCADGYTLTLDRKGCVTGVFTDVLCSSSNPCTLPVGLGSCDIDTNRSTMEFCLCAVGYTKSQDGQSCVLDVPTTTTTTAPSATTKKSSKIYFNRILQAILGNLQPAGLQN